MAYVVTRPCRIGDWREPGEVLSADDLRGRNVGQMEDLERVIRFDPSIPEPKSADAGDGKQSRGRGRKPVADAPADAGDGATEDESSSED